MDNQITSDAVLNRFIGSLLGLTVGDALGLPVSKLSPYIVSRKFQKVDGYYPSKYGPSGTLSAASRMPMRIAQAFSKAGIIDPKIIAKAQYDGSKAIPDIDDISKRALIQAFDGQVPLDKSGDENSTSHEILTRVIPIGLIAGRTGDDRIVLAKMCRMVCGVTHSSKSAILGCWVVAKVIRDCIRNFQTLTRPYDWYDADKSLLAEIINFTKDAEKTISEDDRPVDLLSLRLIACRRKLQAGVSIEEYCGFNGNNEGINEILPFAIFCFMSSPDAFTSVVNAASMGGAAQYTASLVAAMAGAYAGPGFIPGDMREEQKWYPDVLSTGEGLYWVGNNDGFGNISTKNKTPSGG